MEFRATNFPHLGSGEWTNLKKYDTLPDQTISWSKKYGDNEHITSWQKDCMDYFHTAWKDGSLSRKRKVINYNLVNGVFDFNTTLHGDAAIINNEINQLGNLEDIKVHYPICVLPLKSLWGEETSAPFNWRVRCENPDASNEYLRAKTELLLTYVNSKIQQEFVKKYGEEILQDQSKYQQILDLNGIEDYSKRKIRPQGEKVGNVLLMQLIREQEVMPKFNQGWKHATIVAEEYYWIGRVNGKTTLEVVNPLNIVYSKSYDTTYIHDGDWVVRGEFMTPTQIVERWRTSLTEKEVKDIMNYDVYNSDNKSELTSEGSFGMSSDYIPYNQYTQKPGNPLGSVDSRYPLDPNHLTFLYGDPNYYTVTNSDITSVSPRFRKYILVIHACWRSKRKLLSVKMLNEETGEPVTEIFDGELSKEIVQELKDQGAEIQEVYIDEIWEGLKIGDNIYIDIQPRENQFVNITKIEEGSAKLPYTGLIYNNTNAIPQSVLDEQKPWQTLFNILADRYKKALNSDFGQLLVMDVNQIPTKHGYSVEKWLYWAKELNILLVDPSQEGNMNKYREFNQFTMLQTTMANYLEHLSNMMERVQMYCWQQAGFTPQRLGQASSQETATATQTNLQKSYSQTAYYFYLHNNLKRHVLQMMLEEEKFHIKETKKATYFLDDMSLAFIEITPDIRFEDMSIFVTDFVKDQEAKDFAKRLSEVAVNRGMSLYDAYELGTEDSPAIIKETLLKQKQFEEQMRTQEQQIKQQQLDDAKALEKERMDREDQNAQLDRENKLQIEELRIVGAASVKSGELDLDNNGTPDAVQMGKLALDQSKLEFEKMMKDREHSMKDKEIKSKENQKKQELKQKERLEKEKIKQIEVQNKSQEKIQAKQEQLKRDELKQKRESELRKEKLEKLKLQSKERMDKLKIKAQKAKAKSSKTKK